MVKRGMQEMDTRKLREAWDSWKHVAVLVAAIGCMSMLHATYVVPAILREARKDWKEDIKSELEPLKVSIDSNSRRNDRIENKLDHFLDRVVAVPR